MRRYLIGLAIGAVLAGGVAQAAGDTVQVRIPRCEEDEQYLKGKGDFDGVRWDRYVCIHNDRVEGAGR